MIINNKFTENGPPKEFDYDGYPDGIDDPKITDYLVSRDFGHVWKNGFQLKVEDGTWYEVYFKDRAHEDGSECDKALNAKEKKLTQLISSLYKRSDLGLFALYGQITFYVSDKEELLDEDLLLSSFEQINSNQKEVLDKLKNLHKAITKEASLNQKGIAKKAEKAEIVKDDGIHPDKAKIIAKCKESIFGLRDAPDELKADIEVVMAALTAFDGHGGGAIQWASDELKVNREVVMVAVMNEDYNLGQYHVLEFVSDEFKADKELVIAAVTNKNEYGYGALQYASDELKADKEVVMAAVKVWGQALEHVSEEMKADKEVVMAAVKEYGYALEHASDELKADKEVVMAAIENNSYALEHTTDELRADKEVVMAAVENDNNNGYALSEVSDELKADKEVVMAAVQTNGRALEHASDELRADKEVVMAAVKENGYALSYAHEKLQDDDDLISAGGEV